MTKFTSFLSVIVLVGCSGGSGVKRSVPNPYDTMYQHGTYSAETKEEAEAFCISKNKQVTIDTNKNSKRVSEINEDEVRFNCNTNNRKITVDKSK
jgi:hypothetical protein